MCGVTGSGAACRKPPRAERMPIRTDPHWAGPATVTGPAGRLPCWTDDARLRGMAPQSPLSDSLRRPKRTSCPTAYWRQIFHKLSGLLYGRLSPSLASNRPTLPPSAPSDQPSTGANKASACRPRPAISSSPASYRWLPPASSSNDRSWPTSPPSAPRSTPASPSSPCSLAPRDRVPLHSISVADCLPADGHSDTYHSKNGAT